MSFLLSCISTNHSLLKQHWTKARAQTECPVTVLGSREKPKDQGGLLCLVSDDGNIQAQVELPMPSGMALTENGILVASHDTIHEVSNDLTRVQRDIVSLPSFNLLHSLSRTRHGYLAASTGVDALVEFTATGELLWSWWATEHGFEYTPAGERRLLDINDDHRGVKYGTLTQTTHVNSAAELPDGTILATLFHQGTVISIDRESGEWQTVLEGLDHPHAVRVLAEDYITIADTGRGRALLVKLRDGKGSIETEIQAETNWLQDSFYDYRHDRWLLVDGKHSRVTLTTGTRDPKGGIQLNLDPEWRLYEVLPL